MKQKTRQYVLTEAQRLLGCHLTELRLAHHFEWPVCLDRRWRFDIACVNERIAIEISGGQWIGGHRRGKAQESEYEKLNYAQMMGWRVLQFTNRQVLSGEAKEFIKGWLSA